MAPCTAGSARRWLRSRTFSDSDDAAKVTKAADAHATSAEPSDYLVKIGDHDLAVHLDGNPFTGERALISMRANVVAQAMLF